MNVIRPNSDPTAGSATHFFWIKSVDILLAYFGVVYGPNNGCHYEEMLTLPMVYFGKLSWMINKLSFPVKTPLNDSTKDKGEL